MRELGVFMFAVNENYYGRLVDTDTMPEGKLHPELWLAEANRADWEENYLQPEYWDQLNAPGQLDEPCPDVMTFQFLTQKGTYQALINNQFEFSIRAHYRRSRGLWKMVRWK